jgi:hypothetical protein
MDRSRNHRSRSIRAAALAAALVALVGLVGCIPIRLDENGSISHAEWRVVPATVGGKDGIEIRFRNCNTLVIAARPGGDELTTHLRPAARVTDASGKVLFDNAGSQLNWVQPAGSEVFDNLSRDDDLQRIVVPVNRAKGALTIAPACTTWTGAGSGPTYTWTFTPCTTSTRSCATHTAGSGYFFPGQ